MSTSYTTLKIWNGTTWVSARIPGSTIYMSNTTGTTTPAGGSSTTTPATTSAPMILSAYTGPANGGDSVTQGPAGVALFAEQTGQTVAGAMDFINGDTWENMVSDQTPAKWAGTSRQVMIGVPILPTNTSSGATAFKNVAPGTAEPSGSATDPDTGFRNIAAGLYDSYYDQMFANIAASLPNAIIRMAWEFNLGQSAPGPWGIAYQAWNSVNATTGAALIAAWQHIHTRYAAKYPGFTWLWNPNRGDQGIGDLMQYYPGDAYVDWIGLDVYDIEWQNYGGATAEWQKMLTQNYGLNWLSAQCTSHGKKLALPEWGLGWGTYNTSTPGGSVTGASQEAQGGDNDYYITQTLNWAASVAETGTETWIGVWDYAATGIEPTTITLNGQQVANAAPSFSWSANAQNPANSSTATANPLSLAAFRDWTPPTATTTTSSSGSGSSSSSGTTTPSGSGPAIVQSAAGNATAGTCTWGSAPTAGNLLLGWVANGDVPSGYTAIEAETSYNGEAEGVWVAKTATSSEGTITLANTSEGSVFYEISGASAAPTSTTVAMDGSWGFSSPIACPAVAIATSSIPSGATPLVISAVALHQSPSAEPTVGSGWTADRWSTGSGYNDAFCAHNTAADATVSGSDTSYAGATVSYSGSVGGGTYSTVVVL